MFGISHIVHYNIGSSWARVVGVSVLLLILGGCNPAPSSNQANGVPTTPEGNRITAVASREAENQPTLGTIERQELLAAFSHAADAVAAGRGLPEANKALVDRTFTIRMPFGCDGAATDEADPWAGWTYNPDKRVLKLSVRPERWQPADWVRHVAGDMRYETAEGFWIERPWTSSEECPTKTGKVPDATSPVRKISGIAQFFAPDSSRALQRGVRPYSYTVREQPGKAVVQRRFRLIVNGRVTGFPDGQPIRCWNETDRLPPVCLMAVELARVAFEELPNGEILAEWRN